MQHKKPMFKELVLRNQPIALVGGVGIGKTDAIKQIGEDIDREPVFIHLARRSGTDFLIPKLNEEDDTVSYAISQDLVDIVEEGNKILFLDEFDRANGAVRNAVLSLINEREFENLELPDDVSIVLACNQHYSRDTYTLNQAELTRVSYFDVDPDVTTNDTPYVKSWMKWAENNDIPTKIRSFIMGNSTMLYQPHDDPKPFPTPRGWANLANIIDLVTDQENDRTHRLELVSSVVGEEAAQKFLTYTDVFTELPGAEEILENELQFDSTNEKLAVVEKLAHHIKEEEDAEALRNSIEYIDGVHGGEYLYMFISLTNEQANNQYMQIIRSRDDERANEIRDIIAELA